MAEGFNLCVYADARNAQHPLQLHPRSHNHMNKHVCSSQICYQHFSYLSDMWCSYETSYWEFPFGLQVMMGGCRPEQLLHDHCHSHWKQNSLWLAYHVSSRELETTETELNAMAILAIHGCRVTPMGTSTPAAIGIPMRLYTTAQTKFIRILLTVRLERSMAATTSIKLSYGYGVI